MSFSGNKVIYLRNLYRVDDNDLLSNKSDPIVLLTAVIGEENGPFSDYQNLTNYRSYKEKVILNFRRELEEKGYLVKVCSSLVQLENELEGKCVLTNVLNDYYEQKHLDVLREKKHVKIEEKEGRYGYVLDAKLVQTLFKKKMSFSQFRKVFEDDFLNTSSYVFSENLNTARIKLKKYLNSNHLFNYFETRNKLTGKSFSTDLSRELSFFKLHPSYIIKEIEKVERAKRKNKSTYWVKFELMWREYFYWLYTFHKESFFRSEGLDGGDFELEKIKVDDYLSKMNKNPLIKAMNKELLETGYLSNRSRQIYASYLIHCTELDWRYGAWFFQYCLKDYSLYSNWGNWLYCSGHGTDPRGSRFFNINKQLKAYDPEMAYMKKWGEKNEYTQKELSNNEYCS